MKMYFEEAELKDAMAQYVKGLGLSFETTPEIEIVVTRSGKDNLVSAQIEMRNTLTLGMGAGQVEVLPGKPKEDLDTFKALDKPTKAPAKKAAAKAKTPAKTKEPVAEVAKETAKEAAPVDNLFDLGATVPGQEVAEEEPAEVPAEDTDDLFSGAGDTAGSAAAAGGPVEESDQLFG